ncbi:unnamed protein product [Adineta ricciae]|uniref:Uncharacterized protein n=1 Tax=Adineta ricciae TaxID=249248 RepID=A0A816DJM6_ADIRI|nr:unnamed protein product [Adineta ricciae]
MSPTAPVEFLLSIMNEELKQKFETFNVELLQNIQIVFNVCTEYLTELSKSVTNDEQIIGDHRNIERIISKLKQLQNSDSVDIGLYHIEADEYFHSTLFYPNVPYLVKFYQRSVFDVNRKIVCCYFLEATTLSNRVSNYVLGKVLSNSHSQIGWYLSPMPNYYQTRMDVINDLNNHRVLNQ